MEWLVNHKRRKLFNYESKDSICQDALIILESQLNEPTKYDSIDQLCWAWIEYDEIGKCRDKYKQKFKSKGVLEGKEKGYLDHVIPRKVIVNKLIETKSGDLTKKFVIDIFTKYVIGCLITKKENEKLDNGFRSSMPEWFYSCDHHEGNLESLVWGRYIEAEIEVYEILANDLKNPVKATIK